MEISNASLKQSIGYTTTKVIAWLLVFVTLTVFCGHIGFFAKVMGVQPLESFYSVGPGSTTLYGDMVGVLQSATDEVIGRVLSVSFAAGALIVLWRMVDEWCGDSIVGAAITIGLILFPAAAYTASLASPVSFSMFMSVLALFLGVQPKSKKPIVQISMSAVIIGLLPFLGAHGVGLAIAGSTVILGTNLRRERVVAFCVVLALWITCLAQFYPLTVSLGSESVSVSQSGAIPLVGMASTFAMLWVGLIVSVSVLVFSPSLRQRMGSVSVRRSVLVISAFIISVIWVVIFYPTPVKRVVALCASLVFGVAACLPMVLWLRWVMPSIQSVWIWILLPVLMYSCFWVVLGPIDWAGFPYDQVKR